MVAPSTFETSVSILKSNTLRLGVTRRMSKDLQAEFLAPYSTHKSFETVQELLGKHRTITADQKAQTISVHYKHPDQAIAAQVANLFAEEYLNYTQVIHGSGRIWEFPTSTLETRYKQSQKHCEHIRLQLANLTESEIGSDTHKKLTLELKVNQEFAKKLLERVTNRKTEEATAQATSYESLGFRRRIIQTAKID